MIDIKERNLLESVDYAMDIGEMLYRESRSSDELRTYDCGGIPVEVTLPSKNHNYLRMIIDITWNFRKSPV